MPQRNQFGEARSSAVQKPLAVVHRGGGRRLFHWPFLLVFIAILLFFMARRGYEDVIIHDRDGNPQLTAERQAEIEKARDKLDQAEVYFLISNIAQMIECFLCAEKQTWLKAGEIAKIGTTVNPGSRYNQQYYIRHNVRYQTVFTGRVDQVLKKEIELLGAYPLLPENTTRENPLLFPPLNSKLK